MLSGVRYDRSVPQPLALGAIVILFLDFDGVLHPDAVYLVSGRPVLRGPGELFMWAGLLQEALQDLPQVRIVLSTSWVRELRFSRARDYLPPDLRQRVIGATWHSRMATDDEHRPLGRDTWWDRATRYQQIVSYVRRAELKNWIALDDNDKGWPDIERERLVQTDRSVGLSDAAVIRLLAEMLRDQS